MSSPGWFCCFFQAEDGIRDLVRSRGLGDVYKRQLVGRRAAKEAYVRAIGRGRPGFGRGWLSEGQVVGLSLIHI